MGANIQIKTYGKDAVARYDFLSSKKTQNNCTYNINNNL